MSDNIIIEPNYDNLFEQFLRDAMLHMDVLARPRVTHHDFEHKYTRGEIYSFVASLRIALSAMTKVEQVEKLREQFSAGAEKMHAQWMKEQEEEGDDRNMSRGY